MNNSSNSDCISTTGVTFLLPYTLPWNEAFAYFILVQSVVLSVGGFSQAYHIYMLRSSRDVSPLAWIMSALNNFFYIFYALIIRDALVLVSSVVPFVGALFALFMIHKHRHNGFTILK
jgi:lipid-A-disaccharide synthase-like uncharacterized protein